VPIVEAAQLAQALERFGIAQMATDGIAGVGRIRDEAAATQDFRDPAHEPRLRMRRVNFEILRHR
jgi:hypothetical protein